MICPGNMAKQACALEKATRFDAARVRRVLQHGVNSVKIISPGECRIEVRSISKTICSRAGCGRVAPASLGVRLRADFARLVARSCSAKGVTWYLKTYIVNSTRFKGVSFSQGILSSVDKQDMGLCPMRGCLSRQQEHFWNAFVCRNAKATMPGCARLRPVHSPSRRRKPDMAHVVGICGKCARKSSGVLTSAGRTFFRSTCFFLRANALTSYKSAARRNARGV